MGGTEPQINLKEDAARTEAWSPLWSAVQIAVFGQELPVEPLEAIAASLMQLLKLPFTGLSLQSLFPKNLRIFVVWIISLALAHNSKPKLAVERQSSLIARSYL